MMSLERIERITKEFIAIQNLFDKIGFKVIGTKDINNEDIYLVKKKKS